MKIRRRSHRTETTNPTPKWCEAERNWMVSDYRNGTRKRFRFKSLEMANAHCQIIRSHYLNAHKVSDSGFGVNPSLALAWAFLDEELRLFYGTDLVHIAQDFITNQNPASLTTPRGRHLLRMLAASGALTSQK